MLLPVDLSNTAECAVNSVDPDQTPQKYGTTIIKLFLFHIVIVGKTLALLRQAQASVKPSEL